MNDKPRLGDWIQVHSGGKFFPLDPHPEDIHIEDIAHALSHQCRFSGHVEKFYSVAEHSVRVSRVVPDIDAMWGLLHDASEAYLVDVPRPIKPLLKGYKEIENAVMVAVSVRFGLSPEMPASVHHADNALLATEARDLMKRPLVPWEGLNVPALDARIRPWSPEKAKASFLQRFSELRLALRRDPRAGEGALLAAE